MEEREKSGGFSLRKKRSVRPKISAPVPHISGPIATSRPAATERPSLAPPDLSYRKPSDSGENTADYVKRRYSTRVHQLPPEANVPTLPAIPDQYANNDGTSTTSPSSPSSQFPPNGRRNSGPREKIPVDLRALQTPDLRAEQYIAHILANASEADIREYQHELNRLKNRTSTDIQHNVYENRTQFMKITQEADKLRTEMQDLRTLMSELTNQLAQTNASLGISTDTKPSSKYAHRSSVANLEAMWSTQLQEVWKRVEGSQKYLPAIPGRHIVHESGKWVELNTATWRPRRRVHIVLLNDHLLVAVEKKRFDQPMSPIDSDKPRHNSAMITPNSHYVTDRCWPLQDIEVSDISTRPSTDPRKAGRAVALNAINVRCGTDSFTFTVSDAETAEKGALLAKIRKEIADLRKTSLGSGGIDGANTFRDGEIGAQRPGSSHARNSARFSGVNGLADSSNAASSKTAGPVEVDGRQQSFRWVEIQVDELDIDIALQHFDEAVDGVERLRAIAKSNKGHVALQELVNGKVQERAGRLARALIRQMIAKNSSMSAMQQHVAWLARLGFEGKASEAYLGGRSEVIRDRTGQCLDEGDLQHYLYSLSYIYFTLIRNTMEIYQSCFSPSMTSAAVRWAKEHVEHFNALLALHLRKLDPASDERRECLDNATELAKVLAEVGIDFGALVGSGFGSEGG